MTTTLRSGRVRGPKIHLIHPAAFPLCEWGSQQLFVPFEGDATCQECIDVAEQVRISEEIVAELLREEL